MIKKWKQFNELYVQSPNFNCINDTVDFGVLTNLEDERNSLVEGDEVIATYFSGGFDTYQFKLEKWRDGRNTILGSSNNDRIFTIEDAYHIVKKETYDDFIDPGSKVLEKAIPRRRSTYIEPSINTSGVLYMSTEIMDRVKEKYINTIDDLFVDLHDEFNTKSGDANFTTENLIENYKGSGGYSIIETTTYQIIDNMDISSMAKSLKSDRVNFQVLFELKDERHDIRNGDEVILVTTESITKLDNSLIKVVLGTVHNTDMIKSGDLDFQFDPKYRGRGSSGILIIKKETYEDFAGPLPPLFTRPL